MTRTSATLWILVLLLGACSILPGGKNNPAPSVTPNRDTLLTAVATAPPTASPKPSPSSTVMPTPSPTLTPSPAMTMTPPPLVEVAGPGAYPGDLPYLTSITAYLSGGASPVVVEASCEGVLSRVDGTREQTLHPGQSVVFFFVIPPGYAPDCLVLVDGQECGQWAVALGNEEPMRMTCATVEGGEP